MKNRIILLFLLFLSSCKTLDYLEIGCSFPLEAKNHSEELHYTLLNAATILPLRYCSRYISIGGNNGIIEFIKDESPDKKIGGMRIGDKINPDSELFKQIKVEIGVGFYIPTNTGWNAFIGDTNTDEKNFRVLFFFKKEYTGAGVFMTYEEYKNWMWR